VDANGCLVGIFTDGDLRRSVGRITDHSRIAEFMTRAPKVAPPSDLAAKAVAVMNNHNINVLFVTESSSDGRERPIGILHLHDCLRAGLQ
jgi:arabinose-5-phosphate isomerase